jgi:pentatricopeptide repeat protein
MCKARLLYLYHHPPFLCQNGNFGIGYAHPSQDKDRDFLSDVSATTLVDKHSKCGRIDKAHELFEKIHQINVFPWNALIVGYSQNRFVVNFLETFKQMQLAGVKPNSTTFDSIFATYVKWDFWNRVWPSIKA